MNALVTGKQQVTARMYLNSEGGQQVTSHSALRIKMTLTDLKASTDPASLLCLGRLFHKNEARETNALLPEDLLDLLVVRVRVKRRT